MLPVRSAFSCMADMMWFVTNFLVSIFMFRIVIFTGRLHKTSQTKITERIKGARDDRRRIDRAQLVGGIFLMAQDLGLFPGRPAVSYFSQKYLASRSVCHDSHSSLKTLQSSIFSMRVVALVSFFWFNFLIDFVQPKRLHVQRIFKDMSYALT
jgi:hypothetical protein